MDGTGKSYMSALGLFWGIYDPRDILWEQILDFPRVEMEKMSLVATVDLSCLSAD